MSEAEKEYIELKAHIEVLCSKMKEAFSKTIGNEHSIERKNQLLQDQNQTIYFLKETIDSSIDQILSGIKMGEFLTNGGNKGNIVN